MSNKKIDQNRLCDRYKTEKIAFTKVFLGSYLNFLLACSCILIAVNSYAYGLMSQKFIESIIVLTILILVKIFILHNSLGYILGLILLWCIDLKNIEAAYWIFPEYSGLHIAAGVHVFCHVHLELIYNPIHGYATIAINMVLWVSGAIFSGLISSSPPIDMIFAFIAFVCSKIFWYKYKLIKDYEEIERKLMLEDYQSNICKIINAVPEGIVVINEDCKVIMKNFTYEKLLQGLDIEELNLIEKYSNDQKDFEENLCKNIRLFINTDRDSTKFGVLIVNDDYLDCTGTKVKWGSENAVVLTFREITNIVKLENQVTQASKTLKILRGVSHELKTPMNMAINQNLELLHNNKDISGDLKKSFNKNISILRYILSLIRDMIDYSYLKSNNLGLSFAWVKIPDLIEESIFILQDIYLNSSFELNLPSQIFNVYTDKNRLRQGLLSLISTSLGLSKNPQVKITVTNESDGIRLIISFNSYKNFLMNSHDTIDFIHKTLKLKISKKLMHKICTNEVCINKSQNDTINFTLLFDLIEFHESKEQYFMEIPEEGDILLPLTTCSGIRDMSNFVDILIVDDIEINIEILRKMLENLESHCNCCRKHRKYSIHTANSGRAALDMILYQQRLKSAYRIVIMDCLMPGMDGWETSLEINKMFSKGDIKYLPYIIAYSAFDSKEDLEKCIVSGMCCHISKPCLIEELCQAVNDWITRF
ncbi:hypothetical protein SteCoe_11508 [Stentor coeruleus]|uniref:Response regulatory domain-containing protein n=1 Tax=Stentor coeruleus TaxID=5963 RepID=A0A1R2CCX1_9CILI|nr:hypothetical protein SteCoe_11508 [Stentor coeruleus]